MSFDGSIFVLIGSNVPLQSLPSIRRIVFDFNNMEFSGVAETSEKNGLHKNSSVFGSRFSGELDISEGRDVDVFLGLCLRKTNLSSPIFSAGSNRIFFGCGSPNLEFLHISYKFQTSHLPYASKEDE